MFKSVFSLADDQKNYTMTTAKLSDVQKTGTQMVGPCPTLPSKEADLVIDSVFSLAGPSELRTNSSNSDTDSHLIATGNTKKQEANILFAPLSSTQLSENSFCSNSSYKSSGPPTNDTSSNLASESLHLENNTSGNSDQTESLESQNSFPGFNNSSVKAKLLIALKSSEWQMENNTLSNTDNMEPLKSQNSLPGFNSSSDNSVLLGLLSSSSETTKTVAQQHATIAASLASKTYKDVSHPLVMAEDETHQFSTNANREKDNKLEKSQGISEASSSTAIKSRPAVVDVDEDDIEDCMLVKVDLSKCPMPYSKNIHNTAVIINDSDEEDVIMVPSASDLEQDNKPVNVKTDALGHSMDCLDSDPGTAAHYNDFEANRSSLGCTSSENLLENSCSDVDIKPNIIPSENIKLIEKSKCSDNGSASVTPNVCTPEYLDTGTLLMEVEDMGQENEIVEEKPVIVMDGNHPDKYMAVTSNEGTLSISTDVLSISAPTHAGSSLSEAPIDLRCSSGSVLQSQLHMQQSCTVPSLNQDNDLKVLPVSMYITTGTLGQKQALVPQHEKRNLPSLQKTREEPRTETYENNLMKVVTEGGKKLESSVPNESPHHVSLESSNSSSDNKVKESKKKLVCLQCNQIFSSRTELVAHTISSHRVAYPPISNNSTSNYPCPYCKTPFHDKSILKIHDLHCGVKLQQISLNQNQNSTASKSLALESNSKSTQSETNQILGQSEPTIIPALWQSNENVLLLTVPNQNTSIKVETPSQISPAKTPRQSEHSSNQTKFVEILPKVLPSHAASTKILVKTCLIPSAEAPITSQTASSEIQPSAVSHQIAAALSQNKIISARVQSSSQTASTNAQVSTVNTSISASKTDNPLQHTVRCEHCSAWFPSYAFFKRHFFTHQECKDHHDKIYGKQGKWVQEREKQANQEKLPVFWCHVCKTKFTTSGGLNLHLRHNEKCRSKINEEPNGVNKNIVTNNETLSSSNSEKTDHSKENTGAGLQESSVTALSSTSKICQSEDKLIKNKGYETQCSTGKEIPVVLTEKDPCTRLKYEIGDECKLKVAKVVLNPVSVMCKTCHKAFNNDMELAQHLQRFQSCLKASDLNARNKFPCWGCKKYFSGDEQLANHLQENKSCWMVNDSRRNIENISFNKVKENFEKSTPPASGLMMKDGASKSETNKSVDKVSGSTCLQSENLKTPEPDDNLFSDDESCSEESPSSNEEMDFEIKCKICQLTFSRKSLFKKHIKTDHHTSPQLKRNKDKKLRCKACTRKFADATALKAHFLKHRFCFFAVTRTYWLKSPESNSCNICGKAFPKFKDLRKHCFRNVTCRLYYIELVLQKFRIEKTNEESSVPNLVAPKKQDEKSEETEKKVNELSFVENSEPTLVSSDKERQEKLTNLEKSEHLKIALNFSKICKNCGTLVNGYLLDHLYKSQPCLQFYETKGDTSQIDLPFCFKCKMHFRNAALLKQHVCKGFNPYTHTCTSCGYKFTCLKNLNVHLGHSKKCKEAHNYKSFTDKESGEKIIQTVQEQKVSGEKIVKSVQEQKLHQDKNSSSRSDKENNNLLSPTSSFPCLVCPEKFPVLRLLMEHSYTHVEENPFKCERCGIIFYHYNRLVSHQVFHMRMDKESSLNITGNSGIDICELSSSESHLSSLTDGKGSKDKVATNSKDGAATNLHQAEHCCFICHQNFDCPVKLRTHQLTHHGQCDYFCSLCSAKFKSKDELDKHSEQHEQSRKTLSNDKKRKEKSKPLLDIKKVENEISHLKSSNDKKKQLAANAPYRRLPAVQKVQTSKDNAFSSDLNFSVLDVKSFQFSSFPSDKVEDDHQCLYCQQKFLEEKDKLCHISESPACKGIMKYIVENKFFELPLGGKQSFVQRTLQSGVCDFCHQKFPDVLSHLFESKCLKILEEAILRYRANSSHDKHPKAELLFSIDQRKKSGPSSVDDEVKKTEFDIHDGTSEDKTDITKEIGIVSTENFTSKGLYIPKNNHLFCFYCSKYLKTELEVRNHSALSHSSRMLSRRTMLKAMWKPGCYKCKLCDIQFHSTAGKLSLIRHMNIYHNDGTSMLLKDIQQKHNESKAKLFLCRLCNNEIEISNRKRHFQTHLKRFLKDVNDKTMAFVINRQCPICEKIFTWSKSLKNHLCRHKPEDIVSSPGDSNKSSGPKIPLVSSPADSNKSSGPKKTSGSDNEEKVFKVIPFGESPFSATDQHFKSKCNFCRKIFLRQSNLTLHLKRYHRLAMTDKTSGEISTKGKDLVSKKKVGMSPASSREIKDKAFNDPISRPGLSFLKTKVAKRFPLGSCKLCGEKVTNMWNFKYHCQRMHKKRTTQDYMTWFQPSGNSENYDKDDSFVPSPWENAQMSPGKNRQHWDEYCTENKCPSLIIEVDDGGDQIINCATIYGPNLGSTNKMLVCLACNAKFNMSSLYQQHIRTHLKLCRVDLGKKVPYHAGENQEINTEIKIEVDENSENYFIDSAYPPSSGLKQMLSHLTFESVNSAAPNKTLLFPTSENVSRRNSEEGHSRNANSPARTNDMDCSPAILSSKDFQMKSNSLSSESSLHVNDDKIATISSQTCTFHSEENKIGLDHNKKTEFSLAFLGKVYESVAQKSLKRPAHFANIVEEQSQDHKKPKLIHHKALPEQPSGLCDTKVVVKTEAVDSEYEKQPRNLFTCFNHSIDPISGDNVDLNHPEVEEELSRALPGRTSEFCNSATLDLEKTDAMESEYEKHHRNLFTCFHQSPLNTDGDNTVTANHDANGTLFKKSDPVKTGLCDNDAPSVIINTDEEDSVKTIDNAVDDSVALGDVKTTENLVLNDSLSTQEL